MDWGTVELEPEVREWLGELPTARFATAAFYVDLLAEQGPLLGEPYSRQSTGSCANCGSTWIAVGTRDLLDRTRTPHRAADHLHQDTHA
jgi:hypothetical protein